MADLTYMQQVLHVNSKSGGYSLESGEVKVLVGKTRNFLLNDDIYQITDTSRDVVGCGHHDSNKYSSSITQLRHYMKDLEQEIGRVEKEFRRTRTNYNVRQGSDAAAAIDIRHSNVECSI